MKNHADALVVSQSEQARLAICAKTKGSFEDAANSRYPTRKTAVAAFSCGYSNAGVLGMED